MINVRRLNRNISIISASSEIFHVKMVQNYESTYLENTIMQSFHLDTVVEDSISYFLKEYLHVALREIHTYHRKVYKCQIDKMSYCESCNLRFNLGGIKMKIDMRRLGQWLGGFEYVPAIFTQSLRIVLWNQVFRKNNKRSQISFLHGNFLVPDLCYSREVVDAKRRFNEVGR